MFTAAVKGWGLTPDAFWSMTLNEFFALAAHDRAVTENEGLAGGRTAAEFRDLMDWSPPE